MSIFQHYLSILIYNNPVIEWCSQTSTICLQETAEPQSWLKNSKA